MQLNHSSTALSLQCLYKRFCSWTVHGYKLVDMMTNNKL